MKKKPAPASLFSAFEQIDGEPLQPIASITVPDAPAVVELVGVVRAERPVENAPTLPLTTMHQTALVFLDDPIARRLAVAWTTCGGNDAAWFETAGMQRVGDALRISKALRVNGICRDGGVTDALAISYIQALIAKPLGRKKEK